MPERQERWKPEHDVKQVGIMLEQFPAFPNKEELITILMTSANASDALKSILTNIYI
jgi:hypothetical protein